MRNSKDFEGESAGPANDPAMITVAGGRILILGTKHSSREFEAIVDRVIRAERPTLVLVEIDPWRLQILETLAGQGYHVLAAETPAGETFPGFSQQAESESAWQEELVPGHEMFQAVQTARELGIAFECMELPLGEIAKSITQDPSAEQANLTAAIKDLGSEVDMTELRAASADLGQFSMQLTEFKEKYPALAGAILNARDDHMARVIRRRLEGSAHQKILVVCGGGHVRPLKVLLK